MRGYHRLATERNGGGSAAANNCMRNDRQVRPVKVSDRVMSKLDEYRRSVEVCLANAAKAPFDELRAIWESIGRSYELLAKLEAAPRDAFGFRVTGGAQIAPLLKGYQLPPADDRIRP